MHTKKCYGYLVGGREYFERMQAEGLGDSITAIRLKEIVAEWNGNGGQ